jgi:hypothetical protein
MRPHGLCVIVLKNLDPRELKPSLQQGGFFISTCRTEFLLLLSCVDVAQVRRYTMRMHQEKSRIPFGRRHISFKTAVHLIAEARQETIGSCARMLGMSRQELLKLESGRWTLTPEVVSHTQGLLASTFFG